jgi:hypothetical protein
VPPPPAQQPGINQSSTFGYLCSKTFDDIDILNSHKKLDHGRTETGEGIKPQAPAEVG